MTTIAQADVVGVGLNATDTLIPVPHFPERGSKVEIHSANALLGGQVASAMAACQQWGLRTRYVGKLGEDHAALLHRAEFERLGVETYLFTAPKCSSQQAFILVDPSGERTVLWKRDPRLTLLPEEPRREWIVNARCTWTATTPPLPRKPRSGHTKQTFRLWLISTIFMRATNPFCRTSIS